MNTIRELDHLLSQEEDQYYAEDLFLDAEELIAKLSEQDISPLVATWQARDLSWRSRFSHASSRISQSVLVPLLRVALSSPTEPEPILGLMGSLPKEADQSPLCQALVDFAERQWHTNPALHRQLQMSTWNCGLSNRLLKRLRFQSWKEAGL